MTNWRDKDDEDLTSEDITAMAREGTSVTIVPREQFDELMGTSGEPDPAPALKAAAQQRRGVSLVWVDDGRGYQCPQCALFVCIPKRTGSVCPRCVKKEAAMTEGKWLDPIKPELHEHPKPDLYKMSATEAYDGRRWQCTCGKVFRIETGNDQREGAWRAWRDV